MHRSTEALGNVSRVGTHQFIAAMVRRWRQAETMALISGRGAMVVDGVPNRHLQHHKTTGSERHERIEGFKAGGWRPLKGSSSNTMDDQRGILEIRRARGFPGNKVFPVSRRTVECSRFAARRGQGQGHGGVV
jgi:hypothetical protein